MLTSSESTRRGLLRSAFGDWLERLMAQTEERVITRRYFRPPGALPEIGFLAACTRCGACIDVCPPHAFMKVPSDGGLAAGTPYIDPASQPCIACTDMPCASALSHARAHAARAAAGPATGSAALELHPERCLTFHGTPCRVCVDACPVGAAALAIDEAGHPVLRREGCVGCGVCVHVCLTSPSSYELTYLEG